MTALEFPAERPLAQRISSGLRRRAARAWKRWTVGQRPPAVPQAFQRCESFGEAGVPAVAGDAYACPGVTGALISTAAAYGQRRLAHSWAEWLVETQRRDGSFATVGQPLPSLTATAGALEGLLAAAEDWPAAEPAARKAAEYLFSSFATGGIGPACRGSELNLCLTCLPILWQAAIRWDETSWKITVQQMVERCLRTADATRWREPLHAHARLINGLLQLGKVELAREAACLPAALQRADGAVPALANASWISTSGVAHLAAAWYRLGEARRADRCLEWLRRQQLASGGFHGSCGRGACYFPARETMLTAKHFLDASLLQVQSAFAVRPQRLPDAIEPGDGRLQTVRRWLQSFPPGARVADVGCGKGRYLRALAEWQPGAELVGIDPSPAMLAHLPPQFARLRGSLLRIPLADAALHGAFAVESLEHALLPRQAIEELCRVVRPGGSVLIIDKHAACQPLSQHEPWEQWFQPDEVQEWLRRHCDDVHVERIRHGSGASDAGLFLAWTGTRRQAAARRAA